MAARLSSWVSRDGLLIISARGLRTFVWGAVSVLLVIYFDGLGFTLVEIGVLLSLGIAGSAVFTFVVSLIAERVGRKRLLILLTALSGSSLLALIFTESFFLLALFAFVGGGFGSGGAGTGGPLQPLEQASLPETAPQKRRTHLFAIYGIVATAGSALGALAAGLPAALQKTYGLQTAHSYRLVFCAFLVVLGISTSLYGFVSPRVEV